MIEKLRKYGEEVVEHSRKESFAIRQAWREVYSKEMKIKTGKWNDSGHDWGTFSFGYAKCKSRGNAEESYRNQSETNYYLMFEETDDPIVLEIKNGKLPPFEDLIGQDVYVCAVDMSWTIAFTHEAASQVLGPYFSKEEWQG